MQTTLSRSGECGQACPECEHIHNMTHTFVIFQTNEILDFVGDFLILLMFIEDGG